MTQKQINEKMDNYSSFILDKFKDIQAQANSLKNIDKTKNGIAFAKITDYIADIRSAYEKLEELEYAVPEPEEEINSSFFSTDFNKDMLRRQRKF